MKGSTVQALQRRIYRKFFPLAAGLVASSIVLTSCGSSGTEDTGASDDTVTIKNCDEEREFPSPAEEMLVASESLLSVLIELEATDQISAITSITTGKQQYLKEIYSPQEIDALPFGAEGEDQSLENVIVEQPDSMMAGFSMGYSEEGGVTPSRLSEYEIPGYVDSETCLPDSDDKEMGTMPPWEALSTNITNIGEITGNEEKANSLTTDIEDRREKLSSADQSDPGPTVFNMDGASEDGVMTGGQLSISHAVIEASGGRNAVEDLEDGKTVTVSWEKLAAEDPDFYIISDFPGGALTYEKNVKELKTNPATKDLEAVKEERFIGAPGVTMRAAPPMLDAAEKLRKFLERADLLPGSDIEPKNELPSYSNDY